MKTRIIAMLIFTASAAASASQLLKFEFGETNSITFVTADTNMETNVRAIISNDFSRILMPYTNSAELKFRVNRQGVTNWYFNAESPDVMNEDFEYWIDWRVMQSNGTNTIVIDKDIADCYKTNALFVTYASKIKSAIEFADYLSTNDLQTFSVSKFNEIYLTKEYAPGEMPEAEVRGMFEPHANLHNVIFYRPSLLSFGFVNEGPEPGQDYLWSFLAMIDSESKNVDYFPIIYYNNHWWLSCWLWEYGEKAW